MIIDIIDSERKPGLGWIGGVTGASPPGPITVTTDNQSFGEFNGFHVICDDFDFDSDSDVSITYAIRDGEVLQFDTLTDQWNYC